MRIINRVADWCVYAFGGIGFLLLYNILTIIWFCLGKWYRGFFDPFPSNFYTFLVSWLAINMTSLVLLSERRKSQREEERKAQKAIQAQQNAQMIQAILNLSESMQQVLQYLVIQSDENDDDLEAILDAVKSNERSIIHE